MDQVFDSGKSKVYYDMRHFHYPEDQHGSAVFRNRAGDKLWQVRHIRGSIYQDPSLKLQDLMWLI